MPWEWFFCFDTAYCTIIFAIATDTVISCSLGRQSLSFIDVYVSNKKCYYTFSHPRQSADVDDKAANILLAGCGKLIHLKCEIGEFIAPPILCQRACKLT
jgi:hypothetical protein